MNRMNMVLDVILVFWGTLVACFLAMVWTATGGPASTGEAQVFELLISGVISCWALGGAGFWARGLK